MKTAEQSFGKTNMACNPSLDSKYSDLRRLTQGYTVSKILQWWLPLMLLLVAALSYLYYQRVEVDNARLRNASQVAIHNAAQAIHSRLSWVLKDVHFLADMTGKLDINRSDLSNLFLSLMQNRQGVYDQIRLLDQQGKELIRVNDASGVVQLVPEGQLQDKSDYYYFQQAQALQAGEVLISRFDLNVEHSEIEIPYKPMIRFVARAYDKTGEASGFVVLNYLGRDLMDLMAKNLPDYGESKNPFWMVNEKGYWLQGPDPKLEWGFMFDDKQQQTIGQHYPEIWQVIQANPKQGQAMIDAGLLTYTSYHVQGSYQLDKHVLFSNPDERWFLLDFIPASQLAKRHQGLMHVLVPVFLLVAITLSLLLWLMLRNQRARWLVKQREQLFVDIMERIQTGIFVLDSQGNPYYMNQMAAAMVGDKLTGSFSLQDLPSQCQVYREGSNQLYALEDLPIFKALQGETATAYDMEVKRGQNRIPIQVTATPIKDANGVITHAVAAFHDISLLKQQQARIREEETLHRALLDSAIDAIITIDETGTIVRINPAVGKMFGYNDQELLGSNVKMLVPEPYHDKHDSYIRNYIETGRSYIIGVGREVEARCKDGRLIPCDLTITEVALPDKRFFKGILRDISERKRIEQMEKDFIANVSHELRTPLTSISGSLKLLVNEVGGELDPLAKELLDIAHINAERLILLVNDILDIEKLESGAMKFDLKPERLSDLLELSVAANQGYAEQHATRIEILNALDDVKVYVDKHRFIQVMSNLLSNAAKFSPTGSPVQVSSTQSDDNIWVTVIDQGPGVPEHFKDQLFQKFAQAEHADNAKKSGTGLGLCIAKGMIERMWGHIGYDSEGGQGSRFYLELPIYQATSEASDQLAASEYQANDRQRVLICEDNADVAKLLKIMLQKQGIESDVVHNWSQAFRLLQSRDYAAMTLDLMLPDVHWITLFDELRQNDKTRHLPVIVVSAIADEAKFDINVSAINIYDWLSKPIDENRLLQAVSEALLQQNKPAQLASILYLEDEAAQGQKIVSLLQGVADVVTARTVEEANAYLAERMFNLVMINMNLSEVAKLKLQAQQDSAKPPIPVMVLSGQQNEQKILFEVQQISIKSQCSDEALVDTIQGLIRSDK